MNDGDVDHGKSEHVGMDHGSMKVIDILN